MISNNYDNANDNNVNNSSHDNCISSDVGDEN